MKSAFKEYAERSWNNAKQFWGAYKLNDPILYYKKTEADKNMGDQIASFEIVSKKTRVHLPNLQKKIGVDKLEPVEKHEIGHHKFCPYDLKTCIELIGASDSIVNNIEKAKYLENVFADTLLNTHIVKKGDRSIIPVYKKFCEGGSNPFWNVYMRTYEKLWDIPNQLVNKTKHNLQQSEENDAEKLCQCVKKDMYNPSKWQEAIKFFSIVLQKYITNDMLKEDKQSSRNSQYSTNTSSNIPGKGMSNNNCPSNSNNKNNNSSQQPNYSQPGNNQANEESYPHQSNNNPQPTSNNNQSSNTQQSQNQANNKPSSANQTSTAHNNPKNNSKNNRPYQQQNKTNQASGIMIDRHSPKDFMPYNVKKGDLDAEKQFQKDIAGIARTLPFEQYKKVIHGNKICDLESAVKIYYLDASRNFEINCPNAIDHCSNITPESPTIWMPEDDVKKLDARYSIEKSGKLIPEETTLKWRHLEGESGDRKENYRDLLICLDSSGSMPNPANYFSIPVLSSLIIAHSALNRNKKVAVINFSSDNVLLDYSTKKTDVDQTILTYLGQGTQIPGNKIFSTVKSNKNKQHILLITDTGIQDLNSQIRYLEQSVKFAGGGTIFLFGPKSANTTQLENAGYKVISLTTMDDLFNTTRKLSEELYGDK